jgi:histidinol-phosphatase (PHP family)
VNGGPRIGPPAGARAASVRVPLPDYHTHTHRCGHARGTAEEYVEAARARGLPAMGVCDHLPLPGHRDPELSMDVSDLPEYVREVEDLKRAYPGYVLLGIEADYEPSSIDEIRELLGSYRWDYVIGSVHFVDGWAFDDPRQRHTWQDRDVEEVYLRYFELVAEAAETGLFTILGHLDLVKKFGHRPPRPLVDATRTLVERVARTGVAIEVNTAGLRKPVGEVYPDADLLRLLCSGGVPVTFGSDAHAPEDVGRDFDHALESVRAAGYASYAWLGSGTLESRPLPPASPGARTGRESSSRDGDTAAS